VVFLATTATAAENVIFGALVSTATPTNLTTPLFPPVAAAVLGSTLVGTGQVLDVNMDIPAGATVAMGLSVTATTGGIQLRQAVVVGYLF
jgi:hypothetical protein